MPDNELTNKVTLRFYDSSFLNQLNSLYETVESTYGSKNNFFLNLIRLGYETFTISKAREKDKGELSSDTIAKIDNFFDYVMKHNDIVDAHLSVLEKMASANLAVGLGTNHGERISKEEVDDGEFDDLPERHEKKLLKARY